MGTTVRKALSAEDLAAKESARKAMREAARDMGISVTELAEARLVERELEAMNAPRELMESDPIKRADKVAEKFIFNRPEAGKREALREARLAVKRDPAIVAARKILRALPRDSHAVVVTRPGWEIVELHKMERAQAVAPIKRALATAEAREAEALARYAEAEAVKARKTTLKRVPKAEAESAARAGALADKATAKVVKLRKRLRKASTAHVAMGWTSERVGEIRVSLRPQSMANRVAKLAREIPAREDVHPFTEAVRARNIPRVPFGYTSEPEAAYLRYLAEVAAQEARERAQELAAKRQEEIYAALNAQEQERAQQSELTREAYKARRAMAARERRRQAKQRNR